MPAQPRGARRRPALPRYAVIMAGGQGTRFWPRSRRRLPKQLLPIVGRRSLLQETARRLLPLFPWRRMLVVTSHEQAAEVERQLPRIPADHILIEPVGRNTAPCAALAAEWIATRTSSTPASSTPASDAVMVLIPADHMIQDAAALRRSLAAACDVASQTETLVTLGIKPVRAETGYGYIEVGAPVGRRFSGVRWVRRFHEKPSAAVARRYVASGRYLWNSGMFVWRASVFRRMLERYLPAVRRGLEGVWTPGRDSEAAQRLRRVYRRLPSVSVDVGIMQPLAAADGGAPHVVVLPIAFSWSDVGTWAAMPEIWGTDTHGNAAIGRLVTVAAKNAIVYCPERLVALVGVKDLIVVDSQDALLICARERAQDVRQLTDALRRRGWSRYL